MITLFQDVTLILITLHAVFSLISLSTYKDPRWLAKTTRKYWKMRIAALRAVKPNSRGVIKEPDHENVLLH